ncbi:hypothetical protein [Dyella subtropica]|uniref:hypothetical protein n=1 Tax=Dyella subtropica TaxID=2992127 RepID=UPI0022520816|nr:hypothetical protein [Dyella subtropica]
MDLAVLLVNEDRKDRYWSHYNELKEYCEAQSLEGRDHPFLWESLADFTIDDRASLDLYFMALDLAVGDDARPYRASIRFALAERYKNLGEHSLAREYAIAADDEAKSIDDLALRRRISQFLLTEN